MKGVNLIQPRLNYYFPLKNKIISLKSLVSNSKNNEISSLNKLLGSEKVLFFNSGHSALQFFLEKLPHNTRVGVQPLTCPTVFEAIKNAKCEIVFIDINDQLIIDEISLRNKLNEIDVIILTHTFGNIFDVKSIKSVLKDKIIIEDCAHALMSNNETSNIGKNGDISIFSHGFAKFPSVFDGGFLLFNNATFYDQMISYYNQLPSPQKSESLFKIIKSMIVCFANYPIIYTFLTKKIKQRKIHIFNYSYNSSNTVKKGYVFSKTILNSELKNIDDYLKIQKNNGRRILTSLEQNSNFRICQIPEGINFFMLPAFVKNPSHLIHFAQKNGIEIGQHFVQSRKVIDTFGYVSGDCENYERVIQQLITIPTHYNYPEKKIKKIMELINSYNFNNLDSSNSF